MDQILSNVAPQIDRAPASYKYESEYDRSFVMSVLYIPCEIELCIVVKVAMHEPTSKKDQASADLSDELRRCRHGRRRTEDLSASGLQRIRDGRPASVAIKQVTV